MYYFTQVLYSLTGSIFRNKIAESKRIWICNFINIAKLWSLDLYQFNLPQPMYKSAGFPSPSPTQCFIRVFDHRQLCGKCYIKIILMLISVIVNEVEYRFIFLIANCISFSLNIWFIIFYPLFYWLSSTVSGNKCHLLC